MTRPTHVRLGKLDRRLRKDRNPGRAVEQHQIVAVGDTVDRRQRQPGEPVADLPDIERLFHPLLERMPLDIAKLRRRYQQVQPYLAGKVADVVGKAVAQEFRLAAGLVPPQRRPPRDVGETGENPQRPARKTDRRVRKQRTLVTPAA